MEYLFFYGMLYLLLVFLQNREKKMTYFNDENKKQDSALESGKVPEKKRKGKSEDQLYEEIQNAEETQNVDGDSLDPGVFANLDDLHDSNDNTLSRKNNSIMPSNDDESEYEEEDEEEDDEVKELNFD